MRLIEQQEIGSNCVGLGLIIVETETWTDHSLVHYLRRSGVELLFKVVEVVGCICCNLQETLGS
jgi:hypothetical protein